MTLTEQWQKGELELDHNYYIKLKYGRIEVQMFIGCFLMEQGNEVVEVLAEVPTFEEYQADENYIDYLKQCISVYESKDKQHAKDYLEYEETLKANEQLEHENLLLKVAVAELREQIEIMRGK